MLIAQINFTYPQGETPVNYWSNFPVWHRGGVVGSIIDRCIIKTFGGSNCREVAIVIVTGGICQPFHCRILAVANYSYTIRTCITPLIS